MKEPWIQNLFSGEFFLGNPVSSPWKDVHFVLQIIESWKDLYSNFLLSIVQISNAQWVNDPMSQHTCRSGTGNVRSNRCADSSGNTLISYRLPNGGGYSVYMQSRCTGYAQWETAVNWSAMTITTNLHQLYAYCNGSNQSCYRCLGGFTNRRYRYFASRISLTIHLCLGNSGLQLSFEKPLTQLRKFYRCRIQTNNHRLAFERFYGIYLQRISHVTVPWKCGDWNAFLHYDHTGSAIRRCTFSVPRLALVIMIPVLPLVLNERFPSMRFSDSFVD